MCPHEWDTHGGDGRSRSNVVPAGIRARSELSEGTPLVLLDTPGGIVLMTRAQLRARVRNELAGLELIDELLRDRRAATDAEDIA